MKTYVVGGAVRDALLGLPVQDRDHVVIGATPEQMLELGYTPVGKDFPVFLHPKTHEEYALARTERKTEKGYKGFVFHTDPSVTLEQDLIRRDLTINAIARSDDGELIDPFGGQRDLQNRVFRHVSAAFEEDPVRILRLARFAARFSEEPHAFTVAPETMELMKRMVEAGEVDALVAERVWQEISRGLMEKKPSRMFEMLRECGALQRLMPELNRLWGVPQPEKFHPEIDTGVHVMLVVDYAAEQGYPLSVRFAALMHDLGKGTTDPAIWPRHHGHEEPGVDLVKQLCERLRVPTDCRDLAIMTARDHGNVGRAMEMRPATLQDMLERNDAFRKPERFLAMLSAARCDCFGRSGLVDIQFPQQNYLTQILHAALSVNAGEVAQQFLGQPQKIAEAVRIARIDAIRAASRVE
ncbi:multifunctional CCA addition/repair protein [Undibacterium sp. LX40W]|uniref:Multifunctional CCA protein n=1 Tax=Undibacterium nitidum TaxID=2762298 RepID=A0A923HNH5_9BURK|nr:MULTISPECIES: multifunctional CCA addition/repair protein [Undibacterium]MBC3881046.1 multifunctional CCA addition/repair protein [Undibacterium nitidum]MBC3890221.1 multifunctional CCA addition/repair protein [Undibacterium sp. LX40W]